MACSMCLVGIWCVFLMCHKTLEAKALDVIGHCHESVMQLVQKVLPDLWSDHTLGYKTQHGFGAIIESLTTQTTPQPTNFVFHTLTNMSMSSSIQYCSAKGLTTSEKVALAYFACCSYLNLFVTAPRHSEPPNVTPFHRSSYNDR